MVQAQRGETPTERKQRKQEQEQKRALAKQREAVRISVKENLCSPPRPTSPRAAIQNAGSPRLRRGAAENVVPLRRSPRHHARQNASTEAHEEAPQEALGPPEKEEALHVESDDDNSHDGLVNEFEHDHLLDGDDDFFHGGENEEVTSGSKARASITTTNNTNSGSSMWLLGAFFVPFLCVGLAMQSMKALCLMVIAVALLEFIDAAIFTIGRHQSVAGPVVAFVSLFALLVVTLSLIRFTLQDTPLFHAVILGLVMVVSKQIACHRARDWVQPLIQFVINLATSLAEPQPPT